jgi:hypothetical protein
MIKIFSHVFLMVSISSLKSAHKFCIKEEDLPTFEKAIGLTQECIDRIVQSPRRFSLSTEHSVMSYFLLNDLWGFVAHQINEPLLLRELYFLVGSLTIAMFAFYAFLDPNFVSETFAGVPVYRLVPIPEIQTIIKQMKSHLQPLSEPYLDVERLPDHNPYVVHSTRKKIAFEIPKFFRCDGNRFNFKRIIEDSIEAARQDTAKNFLKRCSELAF